MGQGGAEPSESLVETLGLSFSKVTWAYSNAQGMTPVKGGWDLVKNKADF
jgi:hypothetical protein